MSSFVNDLLTMMTQVGIIFNVLISLLHDSEAFVFESDSLPLSLPSAINSGSHAQEILHDLGVPRMSPRPQ
jgi:hypothetical protein